MSNFTFLTEEQCFGNDKLDILKKRGTKAAITDLLAIKIMVVNFKRGETYK